MAGMPPLMPTTEADVGASFQILNNYYEENGFCGACEECKGTGIRLHDLRKNALSLFKQYCDLGDAYFGADFSVKKTMALSGSNTHKLALHDAFSANINLHQANHSTSKHLLPRLVRAKTIIEDISASFLLCRLMMDGINPDMPSVCLLQTHATERPLPDMIGEAETVLHSFQTGLNMLFTAITFIGLTEDPRRSSRVKDKLDAEAHMQQDVQYGAWKKLKDAVALASYSQLNVSIGSTTDAPAADHVDDAMEEDAGNDDADEDDMGEDHKGKDPVMEDHAMEEGAVEADALEEGVMGEEAVEEGVVEHDTMEH